MKLSDLAKETKKLAVVYKTPASEFTINIEYRTQAVTPGFLAEIQEVDLMDRIAFQFERVVKAWDVTDDDDKPIPITKDGLKDIPVYLLGSLLDAIAEDRLVLDDESKNG